MSRGSRCLLLGANGAGKSTLLQLLAGKYMVGQDAVRILGRPAFHDLVLTSSGDLGYLGPQWRRDIAYAGSNVPMQARWLHRASPGKLTMRCRQAEQQACPLQADISAEKMLMGVEGVDAARRDRLIKLLDIDLKWRLNKVSDGQRRRVQICMGLLKPYKVCTVISLWGIGRKHWLGVAAGVVSDRAWQTAHCQKASRPAPTPSAFLHICAEPAADPMLVHLS